MGLLIGIDKDLQAIQFAKTRLSNFNNIKYVNDNHDNIIKILEDLEIKKVDGILLDLGVSSYQLDEESRGFSYMKNAKLDMRMDLSADFTAKDIVNRYKEEDLARILYEYGEEKFSKRIAKNICEYRKNKEIEWTKELVEIIEKSIPHFSKKDGGHPAKRTFQAIRIEVNNEIKPLYNMILQSIESLKEKGRICVITFHSLEDRIVKQIFKKFSEVNEIVKGLPVIPQEYQPLIKIINKKPILPSSEEIRENSRSRSAKLRIIERI